MKRNAPGTRGKDGWRLFEMKSTVLRGVLGALAILAAGGAMAQESTNRVAVKTDWSVFADGSPLECWGVSSPKTSENTKGGKPVAVRRGDILLFVTFRPGGSPSGEVSFTGGYPFDPKSNPVIEVDGTKYDLMVDGEWAWPKTPADDSGLLDALKKGSQAVITAHSARGTQTKDTFSLLGFTAALAEAQKRCAK